MLLPDAFELIRDGRLELVVRRDLRGWLAPLLRAAPAGWPDHDVERQRRGRGEVLTVQVDGHCCLIRPYRRGGLPAWLLRTLYFGSAARPFVELAVTETLRRRGVPVVEVYGAAVQWVLPGCYRGWLVSRYVAESQTLWEWAQREAGATGLLVYEQVGRAVRALHDAGGQHPDLNLNNILVCGGMPLPQICLIDFDRAQLDAPIDAEAELARLERSARKLDPTGRFVGDADLAALRAAYAAAIPLSMAQTTASV
jgi:3-deoxy-D-manno-octulosonic acid kinase